MIALVLALVLTVLFQQTGSAPIPKEWLPVGSTLELREQPPRPPVVRVQKLRPKRKRICRVVHRKPPTVYVKPDIVEVLSYAEFWATERVRMKALAAWCVGVAIR